MKKRAWISAAIAMTTPVATPALAQQEQTESVQIEEILVTAQRREDRLQDVPQALSAFSQSAMERLSIRDSESLVRQTPGLSFTSLGPGEANFGMRGLTTSLGLSPTVAVYVNDTPFDFRTDFYSGSPSVETFDIQRIEVLRGPQGTLFGSSSPGGTIRYITHQPDPASYDYRGELGMSSTRHGGMGYVGKGMLNLPVTDRAALRVVGTYEKFAGYIDRYEADLDQLLSPDSTARRIDKDINDADLYSLRLLGSYEASDTLRITPSVSYQKMSADGPLVSQSNLPFLGRAVVIDEEPSETELLIANLAIEKELAFATLISSTSFLEKEAVAQRDISYLSLNFFGEFTPVVDLVPSRARTYVQEFRVASAGESRLRWVAGLYFSDTDQEYDEIFSGGDFVQFIDDNFGLAPGAMDGTAYRFHQDTEDSQQAIFAQLNYDLSDQWELVAGGRWYRLTNELSNSCTEVTSFPLFCGEDVTGVKGSKTDFSPRLTLNYQPSDATMLYATASRGFRPGGANIPIPTDLGCSLNDLIEPLFEPDKVWNYELGAKRESRDRRFVVNGAVYRIDQKGAQTAIGDPGCGYVFFANAGDTEITGAELEVTARPTSALLLSGQLSYSDAEYSSVPEVFGSAAGFAEGDPIPEIPEWKFSLSGEFRQPLNDAWEGYLRADWQYVGKTPYSGGGMVTSGDYRPDYEIVNLQLGMSNARYELNFYVNNLLDEDAILDLSRGDFVTTFPDAFDDVTYVRPRTIGIAFRFNH